MIFLRVASVVAVSTAWLFLLESIRGRSFGCLFEGACETIAARQETPILASLGLAAFSCVLVLSTLQGNRTLVVFRSVAIAIGIAGLTLLGVQFYLGTFCPRCVVTDVAAILIGVTAPFVRPRGEAAAFYAWVLVLALALGSTSLVAAMLEPALPQEVVRHWVDGKVTIVEVTDFQCRTCRYVHGLIRDLENRHADKINVVRIVAPLDRHLKARDAGRVYYCLREQGQDLSDFLFDAHDLSPEFCRAKAEKLGMNMANYDGCLLDRKWDRRFAEDLQWIKQSGANGVPAVWIQEEMLTGNITQDRVDAAFAIARQRLDANRQGAR